MKSILVLLIPIFLFAQEPKILNPYDNNVTPNIHMSNRSDFTMYNGYKEKYHYYQTSSPAGAVAAFGLGHLFNLKHVKQEYKGYTRPVSKQSGTYEYKFEYLNEINKQQKEK